MTKPALFEDSIYSQKFVDAVNSLLHERRSACVTWIDILELSREINGCGLDTAPRDSLASIIIEDLKLENFEALAGILGFKTYTDHRPKFWHGVDSKEHWPETGCPIDWLQIEAAAEALGRDPAAIYGFFGEMAGDMAGDPEAVSYLACHGLAALNHYLPIAATD